MGMPHEVLPTAHKDEIVGYLESWLVRRFVCGLTPKNYNRFFLSLLNKMQKAVSEGNSLPECVLSELTRAQDATTKWPNKEEFSKG